MINHRLGDLEELQRTQADGLADTIVDRIQSILPKSRRHGLLSERDFWIAVGALGLGIALAKVFPWLQQMAR